MRKTFTPARVVMGTTAVAAAAFLAAAFTIPSAQPTAIAQGSMNADGMTNYALDAVHSSVVFKVSHIGVSHVYGMFTEKMGSFTLDTDEGKIGEINFTVKTASVTTGNSGRDDHLRGGDFFNTRQNPDITFTSSDVTHVSGDQHRAEGTLMMNGQTHPITVDIVFNGTGEFRGTPKAGFDATFTVDRTGWGLDAWQGLVGTDITMMVSVQGDG